MASNSSFTFKPLQQTQLQLYSFSHSKQSSTLYPFKFHSSFHTLLSAPPRISPTVQVKAHVTHLDTSLSTEPEQEISGTRNHIRPSSNENGSGVSSSSPKKKRIVKKSSGSVAEENGGKRVTNNDRNGKTGLTPEKRRELRSESDWIKSKILALEKKTVKGRGSSNENGSGVSSSSPKKKRVVKKSSGSVAEENGGKRVTNDNRNGLKPEKSRELRFESDWIKSKIEALEKKTVKGRGSKLTDQKGPEQIVSKDGQNKLRKENMEKGLKKSRTCSPGDTLRIGLDMCSKRGDVLGAIRLYELAKQEGVLMLQYHYAVLLYLCASAAAGVVQPAKSGSAIRSLSSADLPKETSLSSSEIQDEVGQSGKGNFDTSEVKIRASKNGSPVGPFDKEELNLNGFSGKVIEHDLSSHSQSLDEFVKLIRTSAEASDVKREKGKQVSRVIQVSEDLKQFALTKGFEIYEKMRSEGVQMNEATLTSVARMAMALGNGDKAFDVVKQMKEYGINPRLRSYGPALSVFCNNGHVEKAFMVEGHMLEHGVYPEEPELEALLKVSIDAGRSDKVYYLLHKLRAVVRQVSPSTADLIEKWFNSKVASHIGKRKWDKRSIRAAIENGGGGWHGQGWLGNGKWAVSRASVGSDGCCKCCGEKLVTIDLDPEETENFAKSVASIAAQRERNSSFQKFQRWLDCYGPFEAVIDGANVGLYSQKFKPSMVNNVASGIRRMFPSKRWPLIVLHNRRVTGDKMNEPNNKAIMEKWKASNAIYATPTGSNDDWYWLYAAIKFRCLLVTNDEMRDHLFQLLGNDFFPKWKERHQVRFSFSTGPVFHMPPPYSVVIQESENGCWHVPIASELEIEEERLWLCIRRANSLLAKQDSASVGISKKVGNPTDKCSPELHSPHHKGDAKSSTRRKNQAKVTRKTHGSDDSNKEASGVICRGLKSILQPSKPANHCSILPELESAEDLGSCILDFQV